MYMYIYNYMYNYILSILMYMFFMRVLLLTLSMWWYSFSKINLARAISTSHLCIDLALFQLYLGRRVVYQVLVGLIAFGYPKISWVVFTCSLQKKKRRYKFHTFRCEWRAQILTVCCQCCNHHRAVGDPDVPMGNSESDSISTVDIYWWK